MIKCPVCGKQKSAFQMRPIVNIEELKVGAAMSDQPTEQEVAGQKVDVVCRECWMQILNSRTKEEVIEILETICGVLLEADNRMKKRPSQSHQGLLRRGDVIIEKAAPSPNIVIQPLPHIYSDNQHLQPPKWGGRFLLPDGSGTWGQDGANGINQGFTFSSDFANWLATVHTAQTKIEDKD